MTQSARLNVLGPFEALDAQGGSLDVGGRKAQALIGYLCVERSRPARRPELSGLLWGEMPEDRARHNLRQTLSQIRGRAPALIVADHEQVRLDLDAWGLDVAELGDLLRDGSSASLGRAAAIVRGELLDGLVVDEPGFDEWLRGARDEQRARACEVFERLAAQREAEGAHEEAITLFRRRLDLDPAFESAHLGLMRVLAASGRRSEALRQYERLYESLADLGATPEPATVSEYEHIRDVEGGVPARAAASEPPSVAVLPFEDLTGGDRHFSDGITEDITTALSCFGSLLVISPAAAFARAGEGSLASAGDDLGAQFIVRGSVQRADARVRIAVQLIEAATGHHVWAQRYDRVMEDVFLVQDEVTETVVSTLAGRVEAARLARARKAPPERLDAYDYLLRGKELHRRRTAEACDEAILMFRRAVERDPDFAVAHAWLACGLGQALAFRPAEADSLVEEAYVEAERGRDLDEHESECHRVLAQVSLIRHDLPRARWHQERAIELNPNDDRSVCAMGEILGLDGEPEAAVGWVRRAMRLNPYHPDAYRFQLARALFHSGQPGEAAAELDAIGRPRLRDLAYAAAAQPTEARRARLLAEDPAFDAEQFVAGQAYGAEDHADQLRRGLRAALAQGSGERGKESR